jgi:ureidoacrylate peracid hydrolase
LRTLNDLVDPAKAALIVVDVQNDFCHPDGVLGKAGAPTGAAMEMIPRLQRLLDAARQSGTKVIFVQTIHESVTDSEAWRARSGGRVHEICRKDTWGSAFTGIAPGVDEPVVIKHRYSAFINTRLDSILRTFKTKTLIMTGVSTNVCVESTARQGLMLDYDVVFLGDCTAAYSQAEHDGALRNIAMHFGTVATSEDVMRAWGRVPLAHAPAV